MKIRASLTQWNQKGLINIDQASSNQDYVDFKLKMMKAIIQ